MKSSLRCAACAAPLRADAAGHGHYRMKSAAVGAVAACSRPCGAIGLMLAVIGAPPTKRTAGDAELADNEPKARRSGCDDDRQRQEDYARVDRWRHIVDNIIAKFGNFYSGIKSGELKSAIMMIGDEYQIRGRDIVEMLYPLVEAIYALMRKITDPTCPPYNMHSVIDVAHNIVRRITQQEQAKQIQPALSDDSMMKLLPAEIQHMVAQFTEGVAMPLVAEFVVRMCGPIKFALTRKQFIYVVYDSGTDPRVANCHVFNYSGADAGAFSVPTINDMSAMYFEEADSYDQSTGALNVVTAIPHADGRTLVLRNRLVLSSRIAGDKFIYIQSDVGGVPNYENNIMIFFNRRGEYTKVRVLSSFLYVQDLDLRGDVDNFIKRISDNMDIMAKITPTQRGFAVPHENAVDGSIDGVSLVDLTAKTVDTVMTPNSFQKYEYLPDGSFVVVATTPTVRVARYRRLPHQIKLSDFQPVINKPYSDTVNVYGYRCVIHTISGVMCNIGIVDLSGVNFAD